jgi:hypothetical protein
VDQRRHVGRAKRAPLGKTPSGASQQLRMQELFKSDLDHVNPTLDATRLLLARTCGRFAGAPPVSGDCSFGPLDDQSSSSRLAPGSATEEERGLGVDDFRSRPIVC